MYYSASFVVILFLSQVGNHFLTTEEKEISRFDFWFAAAAAAMFLCPCCFTDWTGSISILFAFYFFYKMWLDIQIPILVQKNLLKIALSSIRILFS